MHDSKFTFFSFFLYATTFMFTGCKNPTKNPPRSFWQERSTFPNLSQEDARQWENRHKNAAHINVIKKYKEKLEIQQFARLPISSQMYQTLVNNSDLIIYCCILLFAYTKVYPWIDEQYAKRGLERFSLKDLFPWKWRR